MKHLTAREVQSVMEKGKNLHVIDVREAHEVRTGKIPNATHIPLGLLEFRFQELDKSKEYIMVCRSGARSASATQFLESYGYKVKNMTGGMMSWTGELE